MVYVASEINNHPSLSFPSPPCPHMHYVTMKLNESVTDITALTMIGVYSDFLISVYFINMFKESIVLWIIATVNFNGTFAACYAHPYVNCMRLLQ